MKICKYSKTYAEIIKELGRNRCLLAFILLLCCEISVAQDLRMTLNFKRSDCGVRRGITCSEHSSDSTKRMVPNAIFQWKDGSLTLTISRKRISRAQEILLFGTTISKENNSSLTFSLNEEDFVPALVMDLIPSNMRAQHRMLSKGEYPTEITSTSIKITLIEKL